MAAHRDQNAKPKKERPHLLLSPRLAHLIPVLPFPARPRRELTVRVILVVNIITVSTAAPCIMSRSVRVLCHLGLRCWQVVHREAERSLHWRRLLLLVLVLLLFRLLDPLLRLLTRHRECVTVEPVANGWYASSTAARSFRMHTQILPHTSNVIVSLSVMRAVELIRHVVVERGGLLLLLDALILL